MTATARSVQAAPRISTLTRLALAAQVFLLRRNLMGPMGEQIMVITTTGRKSGKRYATPIGYLRDGDTILALNMGGRSNWYRNMLANPAVTLEIKGRRLAARGEPVRDDAERRRIFERYRATRAANFERYFGVAATAPADELARALASREFVRFHVD